MDGSFLRVIDNPFITKYYYVVNYTTIKKRMNGVKIMKKALIAILIGLILILTACGKTTREGALITDASPTPSPKADFSPGGSDEEEQPEHEETQPPENTPYKSNLYDPSIFVIEAYGSHRQELAPGYYADYECDLYVHKIDQNNNRAVAGVYQGVFWMDVTINADEFIKDLIGDAPVNIDFGVGGEAVTDSLGISLNTMDDKAWTDYSITYENGETMPLSQDMPVGKGSFVTVSKNVYLEAHASGAQGEKIDYSDASEGDLIDVNYVINVEPDAMESNASRKVTIHLFGEGFSFNIEGVLKRLPGYPEDVEDYYNSDGYKNATWSRLG